ECQYSLKKILSNLGEIDPWQQALENSELFGGDMIVPHGAFLGNALPGEDYRWPNATIPYVIDKSLASHKKLILDAMAHIERNTCLKFKPRTNEKEYCKIFKGKG
ncbi:astacin domain-containing protein, partial [Trichonephila clavata]